MTRLEILAALRDLHRAGLLVGLLVSCGGGSDAQQICKAVLCVNPLIVTLTMPPAGAYRVEAIGPGETTPHAVDCTGTSPCLIIFPGYQPVTVTISIITATGTTTYNKTPMYLVLSPPPPGHCPSQCRDGEVTVP